MDPLVCVTIASPEPLPAQVHTLFSLLTDLGKVCFLTFRLLLVLGVVIMELESSSLVSK